MPEYDRASKTHGEVVLPGATITGTGLTGAIIDTLNYGSLTYLIQSGAITVGSFTVVLEEGDDSGLSDAATVAVAETIDADGSTGNAVAFTAANSTAVQGIGDVGKKRYHRLRVVGFTGVASSGLFSVVAVQEHGRDEPTE
jgi:hypothetical protein